jgi:hypothetical protein
MWVSVAAGLLLTLSALGLGACATSEQWAEARKHPSWFASSEHLGFSWRNRGDNPKVSRQDQRLAASQGWWGDAVLVRPDQIFEN